MFDKEILTQLQNIIGVDRVDPEYLIQKLTEKYGHDKAIEICQRGLESHLLHVADDGYTFLDTFFLEHLKSKPRFKKNDLVKRKRGSWHGIIVGDYNTELTPEGYNVMSLVEYGAVHVEPEHTLEPWDGVYEMDPRALALIEQHKK